MAREAVLDAPLSQLITWDLLFRSLARESSLLLNQAQFNSNAAAAIRGGLHKEQLGLVQDPCRNKTGICPRRAGKSWCAMSYGFITCLERPNARVVICTLTLKSAKNIYWWEMQEFAKHYGVPIDPYINELRIDFANGSKLMLVGMETKQQIDKLRGGKYDLIIIDECKSFPSVVLRELIKDVIWPALGDRQGTLLLIGTPGSILDGPFFEGTFPGLVDKKPGPLKGMPFSRTYASPEAFWGVNAGIQPRWSRHAWTRQANKALPHLWKESLETKEREGWSDSDPTWMREHLGLWVPADTAYVYAYAALLRDKDQHDKVSWEPLPVGHANRGLFGLPKDKTWHFLLGLDLGFEDATAMVIGAYCDEEPILHHVWEFKDSHLDVDQVGALIMRATEMVPKGFDAIIGDFGGGGKQIITTFNRRYGINILPAEKKDKYDFIELLNADYRSGRVRLLEHSDLSLEKQMLQWDLSRGGKEFLAHTGKLREHDELPNHLCDAWLYIWRYSYHFFARRAPDPTPDRGTTEWQAEQNQRAMEILLKNRALSNGDQTWSEAIHSGPDLAKEYWDRWKYN